jgi:hypothetical protein
MGFNSSPYGTKPEVQTGGGNKCLNPAHVMNSWVRIDQMPRSRKIAHSNVAIVVVSFSSHTRSLVVSMPVQEKNLLVEVIIDM